MAASTGSPTKKSTPGVKKKRIRTKEQLALADEVEWLDDWGVYKGTQKVHSIPTAGTTDLASVRLFKALCGSLLIMDQTTSPSSDSEMCEQIGVTAEQLEEIKKTCDPHPLMSAPASTDKSSPLNYVHSPRRSVYYLDRLDQSIISYSNVACEDRIVRDGGGDLPTRVDSKEVILAVDVFHPARIMREQHLLVLGSQNLTALRDKILCPNDYYLTEEMSSDPIAWNEDTKPPEGPSNVSKSAFFFVNNCFYDDMRHPEATKLSRQIISWTEVGDRIAKSPRLDHFASTLMEDTTFEMLEFRLGWPYLYCHHGNCNHLVIFRDMRLFNAKNDPPYTEDYPRLFFFNKSLLKKHTCHVCKKDATWVTIEDDFSSGNGNHTFFCQACFTRLHYTKEGEKVKSRFKAYRYHPPEQPTVIQ